MHKLVIIFLVLLLAVSCQKKKSSDIAVQRSDKYVVPASQDAIDTTQIYISPSDMFNDRSGFDPEKFRPQQVRYRGARNIFYTVVASQVMNNNLAVVIEYLQGINERGDSISTASRILLYAKNVLVYRKAFPIEFSNAVHLASSSTYGHVVYTVSPTKAIIYYWLELLRNNDPSEKEYHAICVDTDGVANELSGDLNRVGSHFTSMRFLNEARIKAKVPPTDRYPYLSIDLIYSIDWKICSAILEVPVDTVFSVSEQPSRFFNSKIKLYSKPNRSSSFRETNFRRLTKGQMLRIFVPSFFTNSEIERDMVFIEFNKITFGWIDYDTMLFEEILSEN